MSCFVVEIYVEASGFKAMENNHYVCLHDIVLGIGVVFTMIVV
jgi:hypothetical protein